MLGVASECEKIGRVVSGMSGWWFPSTLFLSQFEK